MVGAAKCQLRISTLNSSQQKQTHIYVIIHFYVHIGFKMTKRLAMTGLEPAPPGGSRTRNLSIHSNALTIVRRAALPIELHGHRENCDGRG